MKPEPASHEKLDALRKRAEQHRADGRSASTGPLEAMNAQRLLQELEIHQIELEMQNRELQQARNEAEEAREVYRDLYDFAPVGYFSLSREGEVLMANLTGAILLGMKRDELTGRPFSQWITPEKRSDFGRFLSGVFNREDPVSIELEIRQEGGEGFIASLEARKGVAGRDCRMMVTDVTRRKAGEEADRLLKISTQSNRKLQAEILRRQKVEITLEKAREKLNASLEDSKRQRKRLLNLSHALLHSQEEERKRISRELHDSVVQALVAIQYEFELLSRESKGEFPGLQEQITRTQDILEGSIDLIHGFAFELRPSALDNLGLGPTLETFATRFQEANDITVTLDLFKDVGKIGPTVRIMLYRVVQEAFSNVSQHAQARNIRLSILEENNGIRMEITDDGVGVDPEGPESPSREGHLGLIDMKERVEMLGGAFRILSKQGEYTTIQVDLPTAAGKK